MPPAGVAAKPRGVDFFGMFLGLREPAAVEVEPLLEVDVEKVIGRRQPGRRPPANDVIKAAFQVGAVLVEMDEFRMALLHPADVNALGGNVELARKPDTQSW